MGDVRPYEQNAPDSRSTLDAKEYNLHYAQCQIDENKKIVICLPDEVRLRWSKENDNQNL